MPYLRRTIILAPFLICSLFGGVNLAALGERENERFNMTISAFERIQLTNNSFIIKNVDFGRRLESHLLAKYEVKISSEPVEGNIILKFDYANGASQFSAPLKKLGNTGNSFTDVYEVSVSDAIPRQEGLHDVYLSLSPDSTTVNVISLKFTPQSYFFSPMTHQWYYVISEHNARAWRLHSEYMLHLYHLNIQNHGQHMFRFEKVWGMESYYRIKSKFYSKFLEVKDKTRREQTVLIQANSSYDEKQIWLIEGSGNEIRIHPQFSIERCLGVITASQGDGNGVYLNACDRSVQQLWSIIPACMD